jgi:enoyl-CoA hydratase/carnithine racemase
LTFEEYSAKYDEYFDMQRRDGIIEVAHRNGDGWTSVWNQAWHDIGNDPENKVAIITNVGDNWLDAPKPWEGEIGRLGDEMLNIYRDTFKSLEHLVFSMSMPTIGVVNGPSAPGIHLEIALLCDVTICSDDAVFREMHPEAGVAPGDGQFLAFQQLMGPKRAAHYAFTGDGIYAQDALRFGLVSQVCPRDELLPRAREIAGKVAALSDVSRYMTTQIVRRSSVKSHVEDAGFHLAHQMFAMAVDLLDGNPPSGWEASYQRAKDINAAAGSG